VNRKFKDYLFYVSAILLVVSAALYSMKWEFIPYVYAVASAGVALYYMTTPYRGEDVRTRRLHGYLVLAGFLLVASSYLMFKGMKEWLFCLFISAAFQLYVALVRKDK